MYKRYIEKGMTLLSDTDIARISVGSLNMNKCDTCVLGQVYGDYRKGLTALGLNWADGVQYGFDLYDIGLTASRRYAVLTEEWRAALINRKEKGNA